LRSSPSTTVGAVLGALAFTLAPGCASSGPALRKVVVDINSTYSWNEDSVAPGDELEVQLADHPTHNHTVIVRENGMASFLSVGEVQVRGASLKELESALADRYASVFAQPAVVTVQLRERAARHVVVIGEVMTPGPVEFDGRMSLEEALGLAGGPRKDTALLKQTVLVRWCANTQEQRAWKFDARLDQWGGATPLYMQPDDVVFVPNTPIDDVDIWVDQYIRRLLPFPFFPAGL